jgi:hypothetical protein
MFGADQQGNVSGTLNSIFFNGATVTIAGIGDTATVTYFNNADYSPVTGENVTISGLGTFEVTSPGEFLSALNFVDAIDNNSGNLLLTISATALSGYDSKSSIGPIVSTSGYSGVGTFVTAAGVLQLSAAGGPFTFSASALVREPAEWTLMLFGVGFVFLRRRMLFGTSRVDPASVSDRFRVAPVHRNHEIHTSGNPRQR